MDEQGRKKEKKREKNQDSRGNQMEIRGKAKQREREWK